MYERYILNNMQFSSAKSTAKAKLMQASVFDDNQVKKSFAKFKKDANAIDQTVDDTWLRTEYDMCGRNAVQGSLYRSYMEDKDLYPYWVYRGVMDDRERADHVAMEGKIFRIGDSDGDACFPPNDWNCRCSGDNADDQDVKDMDGYVMSNNEAKAYLNSYVDEQFRFNAAVQGTLPNTGSYFDVMANANKGDYKLFNLPSAADQGRDKELTGLNNKGMAHVLTIVHEWRQEYHSDALGNIIFQNKATLANVKLTNNAIHELTKHSRGFENIPDTIQKPDEIWSRWEDVQSQRVVLRSYLKFGKTNYLVKTRDGVITDAFAVSNAAADGLRKGLPVT